MSEVNRWVVVVFAALLIATAAGADQIERYQDQFTRHLVYHGGPITIDHQFGGLKIATRDRSQIEVRGTIRSSDPEWAKRIRVQTDSDRGGATIRTIYPSRERENNLSYSVDLEITVPPGAQIRARNRFGSIHAQGIAGGSELTNGHGSVTLKDSRGVQKIENAFGSITVDNIAGEIVARNSNGSVNIDGVRGMASIINRFGSIEVSDVSGPATIANSNGSVRVNDIVGAVAVVNAFGTVKVNDVAGPASVTNKNGKVEINDVARDVTVNNSFGTIVAAAVGGRLEMTGQNSRIDARDVKGSADVTTSFGTVTLREIGGAARVTNANGAVQLSEVTGDTKVRTTFGSVVLKEVRGSIDVQNQNGAIVISEVAQCRPISLRTSFSTIKVELPATASYAINARTTYGRITSQIPIAGRTEGNDVLVGRIGGGDCKLELINSNGSITIAQD